MVVLIRSISQCWGDGSHYKLWDSYQNQQDLELEALTWTDACRPQLDGITFKKYKKVLVSISKSYYIIFPLTYRHAWSCLLAFASQLFCKS